MIDEDDPVHSPCIRCDTCDGYPCMVYAKADAQVVCVEPALQYPNVTLRTHAYVSRLETTRDGRRVDKVRRRAQRRARGVHRRCRRACRPGPSTPQHCSCDRRTIATPPGSATAPASVGRHLMLHNNSALTAFSKIPNSTVFQKTLGVNDYYFGDGDVGVPPRRHADARPQRRRHHPPQRPNGEAGDAEVLGQHSLDFWITTEDLADGRTGSSPRPTAASASSTTPSNLEAHERLIGKFKGLLETMQCREDVVFAQHYLGGRLGINGVAHQNGTVRFGHDPTTSALDVNCRMHEVDNLYVVDASFFVSSSAVNPTLTIIANSLRVSDHLADRLAGTEA